MASEFIEAQRREAAKPSDTPTRIHKAMRDVDALPGEAMPPTSMMNTIGSHNRDHFMAAIHQFFPEFVFRGKLSARSHVLDIGCGCGRLALPFSFFLTDGKFYGVDVWEDGIKWCQAKISVRNPNFTFRHLKANNNYYIDKYDDRKLNDYKLSFIPDATLDFAFAISVFTHLMENDSRQYLRELRRTLKPNCIAYVSTFIIDDFFFQYRERTGKHTALTEINPGLWQAYEGQDFFCGYTQEKWRSMVEAEGLRVASYETGHWAQKPGARLYQDTFILLPG